MKILFRKLFDSILRVTAGVLGGFFAGAVVGAIMGLTFLLTVGVVLVLWKRESLDISISSIPAAFIMAFLSSAAGAIAAAIIGAISGLVAAISYHVFPRREMGVCVGIVWSLVTVYCFRIEIEEAYGWAAIGFAAWLAFSCGTVAGFKITGELQRMDTDAATSAAQTLDR